MEEIAGRIREAALEGKPLSIRGGGSKSFIGRPVEGEILEIGSYSGINDYDPRELVLTARAGTPLAEIENVLFEEGQMLAFEPPCFGPGATLGGTIACGLSGPRRPYAGSARDFTLGCRMVNGKGELLRFGGQVMKNVAGYDISRLMVGACGTLGGLLEISLKVLPIPASSITLAFELDAASAVKKMSGLLSRPCPVDAACFHGEICHLRLSGSEESVKHARSQLGGEAVPEGRAFWQAIREQELSLFSSAPFLYRIMVKPAAPPIELEGKWLLDWGGAQRWLASHLPLSEVAREVEKAGGQVTRFRGGEGQILPPLPVALLSIQKRLKQCFDPHGILNPGRMYAEI
ncbi:MAG TPA: glycolate oxidase subunit GlcE [Burkholderiales bacterium]|nr:glycolate oxidase subunit GlcE [Burkholderiales bacterium]